MALTNKKTIANFRPLTVIGAMIVLGGCATNASQPSQPSQPTITEKPIENKTQPALVKAPAIEPKPVKEEQKKVVTKYKHSTSVQLASAKQEKVTEKKTTKAAVQKPTPKLERKVSPAVVVAKPKIPSKLTPQPATPTTVVPKPKIEAKPAPAPKPVTTSKPVTETKKVSQPKVEPKPVVKTEPKQKPKAEAVQKPVAQPVTKTVQKPIQKPSKPEVEAIATPIVTHDTLPLTVMDWTIDEPKANGTECSLQSSKTQIKDNAGGTPLYITIDSMTLVAHTKSDIDLSYPNSGLTVGEQRFEFDSVKKDTSAVIKMAHSAVLAQLNTAEEITVELGFWPSWPQTESFQASIPTKGFNVAFNAWKECNNLQ